MKSFYLSHKIKKLRFLYSKSQVDYGLMEGWQEEVERRCPDLKANNSNPQQLRILLGLNRSGTTWMGEVLSRTSTPIRYLMEGLHAIQPPIQLAPVDDHLSVPYLSALEANHPLSKAYQSFLLPREQRNALNLKDTTHRDDSDFKYCLTKQVHSILATEGLLKTLKTKVILLVRNPVYVIDSLLARDHLKSYSLANEWKFVQDIPFIDTFHASRKDQLLRAMKELGGFFPNRNTILLRKVLTVALINEMLVQLADRYPAYCLLVRYEDLLKNPLTVFEASAKHLDFKWDQQTITFLQKTLDNKNDNSTRMPVYRDRKEQQNRPFKFITAQEATLIDTFLAKLDLKHSI